MKFRKSAGRFGRSIRAFSSQNRLRARTAARGFEQLEARQMLTVSVSLTGPANAQIVTFVDDSSGIVDNNLQLRFDGSNDLQWSTTGNGSFSSDLDSGTGGTQVATFGNIAAVNIFGGVGNDKLSMSGFDPLDQVSLIAEDGFESGIRFDSSTLNHTASGTISDVELVSLQGNGNGAGQSLIVDFGISTATGRLNNKFGIDTFTSDILPTIEFLDIGDFNEERPANANNNNGVIDLTIDTASLFKGALRYDFHLNPQDSLTFEGGNSADVWNLSGAGTDFEVVDQNTGNFFACNNGPNVEFRGLGGDDILNIDVGSPTSDVIGTPISFDGGAGFNILSVGGNPTTALGEATFTPGSTPNSANLSFLDTHAVKVMSIDMENVQSAFENATTDHLTVNGTASADTLSYSNTGGNIVNVNQATLLSFNTNAANTPILNINGLGGNDTFSIVAPGGSSGLTQVNVDGGSAADVDQLIVANMGPTTKATATGMTATGFAPINYTNVEHLSFNGTTLADVSALITLQSTSGGFIGFPSASRTPRQMLDSSIGRSQNTSSSTHRFHSNDEALHAIHKEFQHVFPASNVLKIASFWPAMSR